MSVWKTSRSEIITSQVCDRKGWYARFLGGTGIQRIGKALPLVTGGAQHEGMAVLVTTWDIEKAVFRSQLVLSEAFADKGISAEDDAATEYSMEEQGALVEGLLRGWNIYQGPNFRASFDLIEVEQEGEVELAPGIVLQFRPDRVVREKQTGDVYVISTKTTSMFGKMSLDSASVDMQSMSEVYGVEKKLGIRVEGVIYEWLVKGKRQKDEYLGAYRQNSPLIYGWKRSGATPEDDEWAHQYQWQTEEVNEKTGKNVTTKLGKGFRKVAIWKEYPGGVKAWIDDLAAQRIAPRHINALDAIFPQSLPVSRRADEIESWRRQTVASEGRTQQYVQLMENIERNIAEHGEEPFEREAMLDELFPQHAHSCLSYNSRCSYWDICWNPAVKADPLASGLYQIAVPNHPKGAADDEE